MYASISLLVFLTFGFAAVAYGIYALYATVTQTKEAHRRPEIDDPEQMFKFERPSISQEFEKEYEILRMRKAKLNPEKHKEMIRKLVNRALANLGPMRHTQSVFSSSRTMYALHRIDEPTWKAINKMKRDCDIEYQQVLLRAKELGFNQGNIFQFAAKLEAHHRQKEMMKLREMHMKARQQHMEKLAAAQKEQAKREQLRRHEAYLKQLEEEEKAKRTSPKSSESRQPKDHFNGLKKGFLRKRTAATKKKKKKKK
eukprot:g1100.t1